CSSPSALDGSEGRARRDPRAPSNLRVEAVRQVGGPLLENVGQRVNNRGYRATASDKSEAVEQRLGEPDRRQVSRKGRALRHGAGGDRVPESLRGQLKGGLGMFDLEPRNQ